MIKKIEVIIVILILCQLVNASIIIMPESPMNISVNKGIEKSFSMNITNNYGFDIYNLKFYNLEGFNFPNINISSGSTKLVNFNIKTNYSFEGKKLTTINFKYFGSIPEEITTYVLNINNSGINGQNNNHLTIRVGDSIRWENHDEVTHNLESSTFESIISPGSTYTKQFNAIGSFEYRTVVAGITFFTGTIDVINRTGSYLVTNPNYDLNYLINLKSIPESTSLSASISQLNYTIDPTLYKEGLLTITNTGNNNAEEILISSDSNWLTFDENNFNLDKNDIKYIKFRITPSIFETEQTNKSYILNLKVKAINTEEYSNTLNIFITYSEAFGDITSEQGFLNWFANVFCPANPNNFLCNTSARNINETAKIIYRESEYSVNMTGSGWYNLVKIIGSNKDTVDRFISNQNTINSEFKTSLDNINNQTNKTAEAINNYIKSKKDWSDFKWIIGIFLAIISMVSFIIFRIRKLAKKKEIVDVYDFKT